ncbi:MAG: phenylacetate--CoA ligase [Alphaproteobacteria bacterium]|nr:phenylacetate--CoA ligase [Alphaproteobacteria bacterium]MCL2504704.1 phenylacetate--CoA ligase [Alphaproteobacteria bacterium]
MIYNKTVEIIDKARLEDLQSKRLKRLVAYVKNNSPYYQKQLAHIQADDINSMKDISKLPFTTKEDLRNNYPYGIFSMPHEKISEIHMSSGTAGNPTLVGYSRKDLMLWAEVMSRSLACAGVHSSDMIQVAFGYGSFTGGFGVHYGALKLGATVLPMSSGQTRRQITLMQSLKPRILACTPSYALYMAEEAASMGLKPSDISWEIGIFGAEPWSEGMRTEIEKRLGVKAVDIYGLSEIIGPGVSMECDEKNGMHIWSDVFYPEVINPDTGEVLPDKEKGELVITTLTKQAIPLLRYRTRDIVSMTNEKCACGRTMPRISKISGRSDDMLVVRGINIFPSQIEHVLLNAAGAAPHYQIIVNRNSIYQDSIDILVEIEEQMFSDQMKEMEQLEAKIVKEMTAVLNITPKLKLVSPKTLPRSEGKAVRVIDNRKI